MLAAMSTQGLLEGTTAVIVGGHSGFGEAISRLFADHGAHRRDRRPTPRRGRRGRRRDRWHRGHVRHHLRRRRGRAGRADRCRRRVASMHSSTVRATNSRRRSPTSRPSCSQQMHAVQIQGAMYCMRHAANAMRDLGNGGSFVSISSLTAHNPARGLAAYASAKAGPGVRLEDRGRRVRRRQRAVQHRRGIADRDTDDVSGVRGGAGDPGGRRDDPARACRFAVPTSRTLRCTSAVNSARTSRARPCASTAAPRCWRCPPRRSTPTSGAAGPSSRAESPDPGP